MTLYYWPVYEGEIAWMVLSLAWYGSMSQHIVPGPDGYDIVEVTYHPPTDVSMNSFGVSRLNALSNIITTPIEIRGLPSNTIWPDGVPITKRPSLTAPVLNQIIIVVDIDSCYGIGYSIYDSNGDCIPASIDMIIAHELAHAYHYAIGDSPPPNSDLAELQAIADENLHRAEIGYPLRTTTSPLWEKSFCSDMCKPYSPWTPPLKHPGGGQKVYHGPDSQNRLVDNVSSGSMLGDKFVEYLCSEYYQAFEHINVLLRSSSQLADFFNELVMEPIMEFWNLLAQHRYTSDEFAIPAQEIQVLLMQYIYSLEDIRIRFEHVDGLYQAIASIMQDTNYQMASQTKSSESMDISDIALVLLDNLNQILRHYISNREYMTWTLIEPLVMFWSALKELVASVNPHMDVGHHFAQNVNHWLGQIPLPEDVFQLGKQALTKELTHLKNVFFSTQAVRLMIGGRLLDAYCGDMSKEGVMSVLRSTDYLLDEEETYNG